MGLNECAFLLMTCINLIKPIEKAQHLDASEVRRYNVAINRAAQKHDISPYLMLAIFEVESNYGRFTGVSQTNDHGPMQINAQWFPKLKVTSKRVRTIEGSMETAAKILAFKKSETNAQGCWWGIYNSRTPKFRHIYEMKIKAALARFGFKVSCQKQNDFLASYDGAMQLALKIRKQKAARRAMASNYP